MYVEAFRDWLETGESFKPDKEFSALYTVNNKVYFVNHNLYTSEAFVPWGIGAGGDDAEVLCKIGYTAEEAAKEVCKWDVFCGGKIDVVNV